LAQGSLLRQSARKNVERPELPRNWRKREAALDKEVTGCAETAGSQKNHETCILLDKEMSEDYNQ
jgi:hypothetical protein